MLIPALLAAIGTFSGFLAGYLGAGGGFATVVLLIAVGTSVHQAIGTSLAFTIVVGLWGTVLHLRQGTANVALALSLGIPSMATAVAGAQIAEALDERTLTLAFAGLTASMGIALILQRRPAPVVVPPISGADASASRDALRTLAGNATFHPTPRAIAVAAAGGAVIGLLKGVFGVGGGFLLMPFMLLFLKVDERLAVGSSLFAILLGSLAGGARHLTLGNVDWSIIAYAVPGGLVGSFVGARATRRSAQRTIRIVFVGLMAASTVYLLWTGLGR